MTASLPVARPAAGPAPRAGWDALRAAAVARYRRDRSDRFGWRFARGKLAADPVFRHLFESGLLAPGARVLDLGCGQGLVANLVAAAQSAAREGRWPRDLPPPPLGVHVTGVELMPRDAARARAALGIDAADPAIVCGDLRRTPFPPSDIVLVLDVLHYLAPAEQDHVLARVREALPPRGLLLLRVADAAAAAGFRWGVWVDRVVALCRRGRAMRLHGRPLAAWIESLHALGFDVEAHPMSRGTPFANVLLVGRPRNAA